MEAAAVRDGRAVRLAGYAGVIGPLWLGGTIAALSVAQYEFMRGLGWHPLDAPTMDWPSGLALGPFGGWMTAAFLGCGALLLPFGAGLRTTLPDGMPARVGTRLLQLAGVALALLAAPTDPTLAGGPRTPAGLLHDGAYVMLGLTLLPGLALLGAAFGGDERWRHQRALTWATVALAAPAFALKGAAFYVFLAATLGWFLVTGARLARISPARARRSP